MEYQTLFSRKNKKSPICCLLNKPEGGKGKPILLLRIQNGILSFLLTLLKLSFLLLFCLESSFLESLLAVLGRYYRNCISSSLLIKYCLNPRTKELIYLSSINKMRLFRACADTEILDQL